MKEKVKSIEEKYQSMDQITHCLMRAGMYIGSTKEEEKSFFIYDKEENKLIYKELFYIPGLLKLVDEIISNSADEFRRKDNLGLTDLWVTVSKNGSFIIKDNGGIPVVKHKTAGVYVPEFIFGQLRTSSNYDDTEERNVLGTNGLGAKLCLIFSNNFSVYTADGKKSYYRSWSDNMRKLNDDLKVTSCSDHFTETKFDIDFKQFSCDELSDDFISILEKRCIDAAAANLGLHVHFKCVDGKKTVSKSDWHFKTFEDYIELYADYIDIDNCISFKDKQKQVWIYPDGAINIGFVNGGECSKGTHIKAIRDEVNKAILAQLSSKHKIENLTNKNINDKYSLFCNFVVANPAYDSQTKDTLVTPVEKFSLDEDYKFSVPDKFIKDVLKSEIISILLDWYKQKQEVEDQKTLRKLNKQSKAKLRSEKFIDSTVKDRKLRELWIFEGQSAAAGYRASKLPNQAAYLLRGKILNTYSLLPSKIMDNRELAELIQIIGLQWGQKNELNKLNFNKIIINSDADFDGSCIAGLLLNFFNLFPELFEYGIVYRSVSPIITAEKGKDIKKYYTITEYKNDEKNLKGYKIRYLKGLGSMVQSDFKDMLQTPNLIKFTKDELSDMNIKLWFGKNNAAERRTALKNEKE